jgi:hypothetical protein
MKNYIILLGIVFYFIGFAFCLWQSVPQGMNTGSGQRFSW